MNLQFFVLTNCYYLPSKCISYVENLFDLLTFPVDKHKLWISFIYKNDIKMNFGVLRFLRLHSPSAQYGAFNQNNIHDNKNVSPLSAWWKGLCITFSEVSFFMYFLSFLIATPFYFICLFIYVFVTFSLMNHNFLFSHSLMGSSNLTV